MDTSETYIKMCDCGEIREGHIWDSGDFIYSPVASPIPFVLCSDCYNSEQFPLRMFIWLPRQDQLQEMVFDSCSPEEQWDELSASTREHMDGPMSDYFTQFTSMEQLWFAFVMEEKYNKVWNGEEWKKE